MQTRDLLKTPNWKVLAGFAAVSAIGMGGLALADTTTVQNPPSITLLDREEPGIAAEVSIHEDLGFGVLNDLDSPFDADDTGDGLASATGDTPAGLDTLTGDTADEVSAGEVDDDEVSAPEVDDDEADDAEDSPAETNPPAEETESPDDADESPAG